MNNQYGGAGGYGGAQPAPLGGQLDVGDVFRTTFRAMQGALGPVLGCALIVAIPTLITTFMIRVATYLLLFGTSGGPPSLEALQRFAIFGMLAYIVAFGVLIVMQSIGQGGIMYAVAEHLSGRSPSFGTALRVGLSRVVPVVLASLVVGLVVGVGALFCLVPGLVAAVFLCMTVPVCVVERLGPIDSISRGVALTEGHRGEIALAFLALVVGLLVVSCCIIGPIAGIGGAIAGASASLSHDPTALADMQNPLNPVQLLSFLAQIPVMIVQTMVASTFVAVIYARLRNLRDGVDAQAIASVFN